jgi:hypothetical protein
LQQLFAQAAAAEIVAVDLEVVPSQLAALALYAVNRFKRVDRQRFTREL